MNNLILYNDANEKFKYKLTLEGAKYDETISRLCLEFDSGENLYYKARLDHNGNCEVNVKALKNFEGCGKAKIEVIAENTFFTIYEMPFEVKKKVNVKLSENISIPFERVEDNNKPAVSISFERVSEDNDEEKPKGLKSIKDFETKEKPEETKKSSVKETKQNKQSKDISDVKKFNDF